MFAGIGEHCNSLVRGDSYFYRSIQAKYSQQEIDEVMKELIPENQEEHF